MNAVLFEMQTDQTLIAAEVPSQRVLEIAVTAPAALTNRPRPALNLSLIIDRSGSMQGEKLAYVKEAAVHVLDLLQEQDRVSVVAYDDQITSLSTGVQVSSENRSQLKASIRGLEAGNTTDLSGGWLTGCQHIAAGQLENGLNRALLLTDGLANRGITDLEELGHHARQLHARGISTSTFGVGEGFNEHLLEQMSNMGGGNFYYIETPRGIPEIFERELKELAAVTAREVEVTLEIPAQVDAQVLGGWKHEKTGGLLRLSLGDMAASQRREVYVKLLTPPQAASPELVVTGKVIARGEDSSLHEAKGVLRFTYASQADVQASPADQEVLRRCSSVEVAEAATEALKLERQGERERAKQVLHQAMESAAPLMPASDVAYYQTLSNRMADGLAEQDRKASHQRAYRQKQRRDPGSGA